MKQSIALMAIVLPTTALVVILLSMPQGDRADGDTPNGRRQDTVLVRDTLFVRDTVLVHGKGREFGYSFDWQKGFGLTHDPDKDSIAGRPVSYYIDDDDCSKAAWDFYYGQFRPTDDGATSDMLAHVTTDNDKLRPFYRWCLDRTIAVSDGALSELVGEPARRYAEKFPREFIEYVNRDTSGKRRKRWMGAISYSGYYSDDDWNNPAAIRRDFIGRMKRNCSGCDTKTITQLERFVRECYYP